jgi:hypothetical protein
MNFWSNVEEKFDGSEKMREEMCTVEAGYNVGLCDTSSIASDILCHQLIPHC